MLDKVSKMDGMVEKRKAAGRDDITLRAGMRYTGWNASNPLYSALEYLHFDFENGIEPEKISASSYGYAGEGRFSYFFKFIFS